MQAYEQLLDRNAEWALREGSMHFEEKNAVHRTFRKITGRLNGLTIPYAVAGAMAMFRHGYRRFTEHVAILITPQGLAQVHQNLEGQGYVALFEGSRALRDARTGVRIEFLITGEYPGDGKPKPVAFPDPVVVATQREGISYLPLTTLIELKLASGMSSPGRLKDLADVQEMIKVLGLAADFANQLNPFVRGKYQELWQGARAG